MGCSGVGPQDKRLLAQQQMTKNKRAEASHGRGSDTRCTAWQTQLQQPHRVALVTQLGPTCLVQVVGGEGVGGAQQPVEVVRPVVGTKEGPG